MVLPLKQDLLTGCGGVLIIVSLLTGCALKPTIAVPPEPLAKVAPALPLDSHPQSLRIRELLFIADAALGRDQLMRPLEDNAYDWYQQVLAVDEGNPEAHRGMTRITERYLELAVQAFKRGRARLAEQMLSGAGRVAATPAQLEQIRLKYSELSSPERQVLLPTGELSARSDSMLGLLSQLANKARQEDYRLVIIARNDTEARWIYRQMQAAVSGYRLRGNIEIGPEPKIVMGPVDSF